MLVRPPVSLAVSVSGYCCIVRNDDHAAKRCANLPRVCLRSAGPNRYIVRNKPTRKAIMPRSRSAPEPQSDPLETLGKFRIIIRAAQRHSSAIQKQCGVQLSACIRSTC